MNNAPAGTIRAALRYPAFRRLLTGLAVSQTGDWLYNLALVALVFERTHSALWAGVTTAARVIPMVVLGPLGGVVADRFDRRRVMIASDLIRLALMLVLALVAAAHLPVLLAPLIAAVATAAGTPYPPSASATTPRLVPDADLPGANAARSAVTGLGIIVGPALGGLLLLLGSPALAFSINGLTFGLSAVVVLAIPAGDHFRPGSDRRSVRPSGVLSDIVAGAAELRRSPVALRLIGADVTCSVVYGMQTVLLLLVARQSGLGLHGYGYLFAAIGVGGLAGTALASRALRQPSQRAMLADMLCAVGLPMLLLAVVRGPVPALVLVAVTGTGAILVEIVTETGLQRTLPAEVLGRAYGLALPAAVAGIALGSLVAPLLVAMLGTTGALLVCGAVAPAYALTLPRLTRSVREPQVAEHSVAEHTVAEHTAELAPAAETPADAPTQVLTEAPTEVLTAASGAAR
ncbi:MAG TPA: MFS transporter [Streptosporangiaceae bacterium]|nr:MFS transporter [Streptosporangiaceae bacterium]